MIDFGVLTKFAYPLVGADGTQHFEWKQSADQVSVIGSWDKFEKPIPLNKISEHHYEIKVPIQLPEGEDFFKFKFIVDGKTTVSSLLPIERKEDENGIEEFNVASPDYEIIVATTRPETMLGDTGVAIHPAIQDIKNSMENFCNTLSLIEK
eukprot:TRINITY_DN4406_c0_g1_i7.p1 TRINITY_DN4406_c0_g1~~TRINITY_DN4406_c0_g1_i7.p1  ORF type:complete len:151 (-),score=26.48 TRINITY_DN4406_c0_g1_i7:208-660(-)